MSFRRFGRSLYFKKQFKDGTKLFVNMDRITHIRSSTEDREINFYHGSKYCSGIIHECKDNFDRDLSKLENYKPSMIEVTDKDSLYKRKNEILNDLEQEKNRALSQLNQIRSEIIKLKAEKNDLSDNYQEFSQQVKELQKIRNQLLKNKTNPFFRLSGKND